MKKRTEPTAVSIVFDALIRADDFLTGRHLQKMTNLSSNRVSAALYNLLKYKAANYIEAEKKLWWYPTPETDTRSRVIPEKVPETKPRKPRKRKAKTA